MAPGTPIRVLIADERRCYAEALSRALESEPDLTAFPSNVYEAVPETADRLRIDLLLIGITAGEPDSFTVTAETRRLLPAVKVVFLDGEPSDIVLEQAARVDANGFLLAAEPLEAITNAIRDAAAGRPYFSERLRGRLRIDGAHGRLGVAERTKLSQLTARQLQVLRLLAKGRSVKEVARALGLSEKSVDSHKYRIMSKLDIHDRVELARYAIREGLVTP